MLQDFRVAARALSKNPVFSLTAIAVLALGIGANSAVFGLVNQALFSPPGLSDPSRVVAVRASYLKLNLPSISLSGPDFRDVRNARDVFERTAVMDTHDVVYLEGGEPKVLRAAAVSLEWFDVFAARPTLGRTFVKEEDEPDGPRTVVLSHAAWVRVFGSDPSIIGRLITIDDKPSKVVGVMSPDFRWPREVDLWLPLALARAEFTDDFRFNEHLFGAARLRPGVTKAAADARIGVLAARVRSGTDENAAFARSSEWGMFVMPFTEYVAGDSRLPMLVLLGAVGFVLLIACANIAGLMLARTSSRNREIAVRAALGAGRWHLIRQTLAESLLLSGVGALLGLAVASAGMRLMIASAPQGSVVGLTPAIDLPVLSFTLGVAVTAALLFALAPAWQITRVAPVEHLKSATRSAAGSLGRQRMRSALVVGETAMAMVLLVGSGLLIKSLSRLQEVNPGFDPRGVVIGGVSLPERRYKTPEQRLAFYRALTDRLRENNAVVAVGAGAPLPFEGGDSTASFRIEGQTLAPNEPGPHGRSRVVSPGYFAALGIPRQRGRVFTDDDRLGTDRVVVIDENLAKQYWPGQDPIGKRILGSSSTPWATIVGVVGNVLHTSLAGESDKGTYYQCLYQRPMSGSELVVRLRPGVEPSPAVIAAAVKAIDPTIPVQRARTMRQRLDESLAARRFVVHLLIFFAGVALLMAALGLYGVISYSVLQRTQEIGVRMALGAGRRSVVGLVLRQGTALALIGIVAGSAASAGLSRLLASQLFDVSPFDPLTFAGMVAVLMLTAFAASFIPAYAASRIDPLRALRYE
jgi:putative ABC transport system permease protein